ncbi:MAG: long-chain fatty acid--CoA ligase [Firmicutes bacterium]|nr:long-chain fatty acid--CoA ligase [Bacillota bacterium]
MLRAGVNMPGQVPTYEEMPRRTLTDKGACGPTAAHVIEEVHTPLNYAYISFTTGSTAFQNVVGVTLEEIPDRVAASLRAFKSAGISRGAKGLFTYPPLVLVFPREALKELEISISYLLRSTRDAFLLAVIEEKPDFIVGESAFINHALQDARKLGIESYLPPVSVIFVAGTPMDLDLIPTAKELLGARVHDLYGCQEFGWLTMDGVPLRDDITLLRSPLGTDYYELIVGGLPMSDSFPVSSKGHVLNSEGRIITYRRMRTYPDFEVWVLESPLPNAEVVQRVARTILRTKARIVKCSPKLKTGSDRTLLKLALSVSTGNLGEDESDMAAFIEGPEKTRLFDVLGEAQVKYELEKVWDPAYTKRR